MSRSRVISHKNPVDLSDPEQNNICECNTAKDVIDHAVEYAAGIMSDSRGCSYSNIVTMFLALHITRNMVINAHVYRDGEETGIAQALAKMESAEDDAKQIISEHAKTVFSTLANSKTVSDAVMQRETKH